MQRVKTSTVAAALPAYSETGTPGFFTVGNAVAGIPATTMGQDWPNMIQEELCNVVEAAGLTPSATDDTQLGQAIAAMIMEAAPAAATTSAKGIVELATSAETTTGTDTERAVTPAGLLASIQSLVAGCIAAVATAAGFLFSFGNPGCLRLPTWLGGWIFAFGTGTTDSSAGLTATYYMAFPLGIFGACACPYGVAGNTVANIPGASTTGISIVTYTGSTGAAKPGSQVAWLVWGK